MKHSFKLVVLFTSVFVFMLGAGVANADNSIPTITSINPSTTTTNTTNTTNISPSNTTTQISNIQSQLSVLNQQLNILQQESNSASSAPSTTNTTPPIPAPSANPTAPLNSNPNSLPLPTVSSGALLNRYLGFGDTDLNDPNKNVEKLQTFLEQEGFLIMPPGVAKGFFGLRTKSALEKFQAAHSFAQLGVLGPRSLGFINNLGSGISSGARGQVGGNTVACARNDDCREQAVWPNPAVPYPRNIGSPFCTPFNIRQIVQVIDPGICENAGTQNARCVNSATVTVQTCGTDQRCQINQTTQQPACVNFNCVTDVECPAPLLADAIYTRCNGNTIERKARPYVCNNPGPTGSCGLAPVPPDSNMVWVYQMDCPANTVCRDIQNAIGTNTTATCSPNTAGRPGPSGYLDTIAKQIASLGDAVANLLAQFQQ